MAVEDKDEKDKYSVNITLADLELARREERQKGFEEAMKIAEAQFQVKELQLAEERDRNIRQVSDTLQTAARAEVAESLNKGEKY